MIVYPQFIYAYLDASGAMFEFSVNFFIVSPRDSAVEAFYSFDKNHTASQEAAAHKIDNMKRSEMNKRTQRFIGSDENETNEKKPFKFDRMTGGGIGDNVRAQCALYSTNADGSFTVVVSVASKKANSVLLKYQGDKPSWLPSDGTPLSGHLMMYEVKNFNAKAS